MMALPIVKSIEAAWLSSLAATIAQPQGRMLHLVVPISEPAAPDLQLIELIDSVVVPKRQHNVSRVASTVFPSSCYLPPDLWYSPDMPASDLEALDGAARDLYQRYEAMLPVLQGLEGNSHGTYFGRLISWPGKTAGGYNQLATRVRQLRSARKQRLRVFNAADMTLDGTDVENELVAGLSEYAFDDERTQGFPCLVHLDISVLNNRLNLLAVYRHWHVIRKAYGNLIGLTRLQHFLAQQSGYEVGELLVHGTVANAETSLFSRRRVVELVNQARNLVPLNSLESVVDAHNGHLPTHLDSVTIGSER